LSKESES
jgi:hypothetical protein